MKKTLTLLTLAVLSFGLIAFDADAKRMGGGKNMGQQRDSISQKQATPSQSQTPSSPNTAAAAAPSGASKWAGPLAGLAAGGLLAALFMGGAFDGINMMDMLMLALIIGAVFFVIRMLRKPRTEESTRPMQYAGHTGTHTQDTAPVPPFANTAGTSATGQTSAPQQSGIPADFKVEPFIRNAKASFIRLQTAHDRGNIDEIRDYTTPEMLAEISAQINERGDAQQKTEVMFIDANLLDVETTNDTAIASVRFTGQLRDLPEGEPEAFDEIWHVQKDLKDPDSTWLLAGIQQTS